MAVEICGLVSRMFYRDELRVSEHCLLDDNWRAVRQPIHLFSSGGVHNLHLIEIGTESVADAGSHRRPESAQAAVAIAQELGTRIDHRNILILTPFVAQRRLIRKEMDARGMRRVRVNTVHASQGAEFHTVIFDPVKGNSRFLMDPKSGPRLLNVAISRTQACFVLLASNGDLKHPLLSAIADYIRDVSAPPVGSLTPPAAND
jgi:superfamily I DNA and/or RNA helicase